jgi:hypothetical protein
MLNLKSLFGLLAICALTFAGCATTGTTHDHAPAAAAEASGCGSCAKGKSGEATWCDHCGVGYVEGEKVACKGCFKSKTGSAAPCGGCAKATTAGHTDESAPEAASDTATN